MFEENADWEGVELNSSLSEALLAKPVATPTKKSKNKFRPDAIPGKKKSKSAPPVPTPAPKKSCPPLGKRKREAKTKVATTKSSEPKKRHVKCNVIFDDFSNWESVIADHEAEDPQSENLGQFMSSAAHEIEKENQTDNTSDNVSQETSKKTKKKKKAKCVGDGSTELSSESDPDNSKTHSEVDKTESVTETSSLQSAKEKISKLKGKFQKKMDGSQFRFINEKLYTTTGDEALDLFKTKPELFDVYHRGFSNQVEKWEINPVDRIIELIKASGEDKVVADFGCGDAKIARTLEKHAVFSFDLVQYNDHIIVANSSKVPLGNKSVNIAVFCLSLMGTDFKDFIREGRRVLKSKGRLIIAEVMSRIPDKDEFVRGIEEIGFSLLQQNEPNNYFIELVFKKTKPKENKAKFENLTLKPCTYKKR